MNADDRLSSDFGVQQGYQKFPSCPDLLLSVLSFFTTKLSVLVPKLLVLEIVSGMVGATC